MSRFATRFLFAFALVTAALWRLNRLTDLPVSEAGDPKRAFLAENGEPDPRLSSALGSMADIMASSRQVLPANSLEALPEHERAELPEELVAQINLAPDRGPELVRAYVSSLRADDFEQRKHVLNFLRAVGPGWSPLSQEIALRMLETRNVTSFATRTEIDALGAAGATLADVDASQKSRLWEQIRQLHPQPETLREISQGMRIDLANASEANSYEND